MCNNIKEIKFNLDNNNKETEILFNLIKNLAYETDNLEFKDRPQLTFNYVDKNKIGGFLKLTSYRCKTYLTDGKVLLVTPNTRIGAGKVINEKGLTQNKVLLSVTLTHPKTKNKEIIWSSENSINIFNDYTNCIENH